MPELPTNLPLEKILPWAAGGLGIAALENKLVGENLPPELQNVNLGIGGVSGLLAANPAHRAQVLSSLPFKQMGLFGIGAIDKLRRQQQELTDTNLATAKIHQNTAAMEGENASGKAKQIAAFLIPALLGSGALAYYAYNQRKKERAKGFETVGQRGTANRDHRKVKIDVPASALPPEFFSSLVHADDTPRSRIRFMQKAAMYNGESLGDAWRDSFLGRLAHGAGQAPRSVWQSGPAQTARDIGGLGFELTGVPTLGRTVKDLGLGLGSQSGGNEGSGNRYLLAGAGGALLSGAALKSGILPLAAKLIGPGRLMRQIRPDTLGKAIRNPVLGTPNLAQGLLNTISGRALSTAERAALTNPATRDATFKSLYNKLDGGNRHLLETMNDLKFQFSPRAFRPGRTPSTLVGEAVQAGRRGLHGASELGRRGYNFARRHPFLTAYGVGTPAAFLGTLRDDEKYRDLVQRTKDYLPNPPQYGPWRMPLSSQLAQMLSNVGSEGMPAVAQQVMGMPRNAFEAAGMR